VSSEVAPDVFREVATAQWPPVAMAPTQEKASRPPGLIRLRTGDRVRIEVIVGREGYVTVFAIGPTGQPSLLYPNEPSTATLPTPVEAHRPLHVVDVELTPPTGRERLFAVWSRAPLPLLPEQLRSLADRGELPGSGAYHATRGMKRVQQSVQKLPPDDWHAVVLELDHHQ
jgi:hypothetical protein